MELTRGVLKSFAKITDDSSNKKTSTSVHATAVVVDGKKYAQIDGSTVLTPISETTDVQTGDRILVSVENHSAVVIGNFTYPPSARTANKALEESERASNTANSAVEKAETAQTLASESQTLSSQANAASSQAIAAAQAASTAAQNAQSIAQEASNIASAAQTSANDSLAATAEAQKQIESLNTEVNTVKSDVASARAEATAQITALTETMTADYAKKTEVTAVEGRLTAEISKSAAELRTTMSENYTAKSEAVSLEERLQSQITQNAEGLTSVASRTTKLETDTTEAQKQIDAAKASAATAQSKADAAQTAAANAQTAADQAKAAAETAASNAATAQSIANAAKTKADEADAAAKSAQDDLDAAKANLTEVTNRVGATEEEIAAAQSAVDAAQAAADQAQSDATAAHTAASNAQTAADKAKADAATAQSAATAAQTKADNASAAAANAQTAADQAQADVNALKSRVTTAETQIAQNAEAITLRATKTELTNAVNDIQVGGRNLALKTGTKAAITGGNTTNQCVNIYTLSKNWTEFAGKYVTISFDYVYSEGATCTNSSVTNSCIGIGMGASTWNRPANIPAPSVAMSGHVSKTFLVSSNVASHTVVQARIDYLSGTCTISNFKFEIGNKATDWTPAPEDQDAATQAVANDLANNYYTKTQTDSAIQVKADSILSTVSSTYQTKDAMGNYSTTAQMNSAINQSATSIKSEVSATYATNAKVDGIQVGGRNLLFNSKGDSTTGWFFTGTVVDDSRFGKCIQKIATGTSEVLLGTPRTAQVDKSAKYTFSCYVWVNSYVSSVDIWWLSDTESDKKTTSNGFVNTIQILGNKKFTPGQWNKVEITFTTNSDDYTGYIRIDNNGSTTSGSNASLYITRLKLERGTKATDWTPAPEDVDSSIGEVKTIAEQTATKIGWIVKSGTSETNFTLTDRTATLVAQTISLNGNVKVNGAMIVDGAVTASKIAANSITANKLAIGDFTNYCTVNPNYPDTMLPTSFTYGGTIVNGTADTGSYVIRKANESQTYLMFCDFTPMCFNAGDELYFYGNIPNFSTTDCSGRVVIWLYDSNKKYVREFTLWSGTFKASTWNKVSGGKPFTGANINGARYFLIGIDSGNASHHIGACDLICRKKSSGALIVDGTITTNKLAANSITTAKLATDAIKSTNYAYSSGNFSTAGTFLDLSTGIIRSKNFAIDSSGNAYLNGKIQASSGTIGRYTITATSLYAGTGSSQAGIGGNQAFWAGSTTSDSAPFRVSYSGQLVAKDLASINSIKIYDEMNEEYFTLAQASASEIVFPSMSYFTKVVSFEDTTTIEALVARNIAGDLTPNLDNSYNLGDVSKVYHLIYSRGVRLGMSTYSASNGYVSTLWKDNAWHDLLVRNSDGLTTGIGWLGSADYASVLQLRSRTVMLRNSSGNSTLSDERLKKNFSSLKRWEGFYLDLEPTAYQYKNGSSGRNHIGYRAQQVESALEKNGLTTKDFAGFVKYHISPDDESFNGYETEYGLIYTEFTALNTYMTQKNVKAIKELDRRFTVLDGKVSSTYARIGSAEERIDKLEKENKQLKEEIAQLKMAA